MMMKNEKRQAKSFTSLTFYSQKCLRANASTQHLTTDNYYASTN